MFTNAQFFDPPELSTQQKRVAKLLIDYTHVENSSWLFKFKMIIPSKAKDESLVLKHGYAFTLADNNYLKTIQPDAIDFFTSLIIQSVGMANTRLSLPIHLDKESLHRMVAGCLAATQN